MMLETLVVRGTAILVLGFLVTWALRRSSAAVRHLGWVLVFGSLLMLPLLTSFAPRWDVPAPALATVQNAVSGEPVVYIVEPGQTAAAPEPIRWTLVWVVVWLAGAIVFLVRLLAGLVRLRRIAARARLVEAGPAELLESEEVSVPVTFGFLRPRVLLPSVASVWAEPARRLVLAHEMAHVGRADWLTQMIAEIGCVIYWFHPLAWLAARRMRAEREHACDDAVLQTGARASEYATHLLAILDSMQKKERATTMAISAHSNNLEGRLRAILNPGVNRRSVSLKAAMAVAVVALCVLIPVAAVRAQSGTGSIAGVVVDPTGAVIPEAPVKVTPILLGEDRADWQGTPAGVAEIAGATDANVQQLATASNGQFQLAGVEPGAYLLHIQVRGFRPYERLVWVRAGQGVELVATMNVADVSTTVKVVEQRQNAMPQADVPHPAGVGGVIQAARLIRQTRPVYPQEARSRGVEGVVELMAVIGKSGNVTGLQVLSRSVDLDLIEAALDAVSRWVYQPTLLNGEPVEAVSKMQIEFALE